MLAAAAVVGAAVVLTPAATPQSQPSYPDAELTVEQKAYLDELWVAVETADLAALEVLVRDETGQDIYYNVMVPYAHRMLEEYGLWDAGIIAETDPEGPERSSGTYICYDGEALGVNRDSGKYLRLSYLYYSNDDESSDIGLDIDFYDDTRLMSEGIRGHGHIFVQADFYEDSAGWFTHHLCWEDMTFRGDREGYYEAPVGEWTLRYHEEEFSLYDTAGVVTKDELIRGEFQAEHDILIEDGSWWTSCLENGQVTLRYSDGSGRAASGTVDVADGYMVRWDDTLSLELIEDRWTADEGEYSQEYYQIWLDLDGDHTAFTRFIDVWRDERLQEDPLYHLFSSSIAFADRGTE